MKELVQEQNRLYTQIESATDYLTYTQQLMAEAKADICPKELAYYQQEAENVERELHDLDVRLDLVEMLLEEGDAA